MKINYYLANLRNRIPALRHRHILCFLIILGLVFYFNAIFHPFVHDDVVFIQENPHITDLNFKSIFIQPVGGGSNRSLINTYYRPLLELFYRIEYRLFGFNPYGFHLINILLHILNSWLVYCLINTLWQSRKGLSLTVSILFLLHPVQSEAVACISGISNLLFTFFCLISLSFYIFSNEKGKDAQGMSFYIFSLIIFFLALLTKEHSVILPMLIIVYEVCFSNIPKISGRKRIFRVAGFFVVLIGYFLLRKTLFGYDFLHFFEYKQEFFRRLLTIPRILLTHFGVLFFPRHLHYYRCVDFLQPFVWPLVLLLVLTGFIFLIIRSIPNPTKRLVIFGLSWFMISLLPTLNIFPLINEYSLLLTAQHFLYFPIIGMLLCVTAAGSFWLERKNNERYRQASMVVLIFVVSIFAVMTIKQNTYWKDEITLFERTLQFEKDFGRVRILLAKAYCFNGQYEKALEENEKALKIMEGYWGKVNNELARGFYLNFIKEIHIHMAHCFEAMNSPQQAILHYNKVVEMDPNFWQVYNNLGLNYVKIHDIPSAVQHFEKAVHLNKSNLMTVNNLAICYIELGELEKAEELLRYIVDKDSQSVSAKKNLEKLLLLRENFRE